MSITNSFLSITDHLPADLVRSLWLVQSLNIRINKLQHKISRLSESDPDFKAHYLTLSSDLHSVVDESISESRSLNNQLIIYQDSLGGQLDKFHQLKYKNNRKAEYKSLREKLKAHYLENPLTSQQEALEEKQQNERLVLKLPKLTKQPQAGPVKKVVRPVKVVPSRQRVSKPIQKPIQKSVPVPKVVSKVVPKKVEPEPELVFVPVVEDTNKYCFCGQGSFGDMIACDNERCKNGEWFHYKCVGLLNRVEALKYTTGKIPWFCSEECREKMAAKKRKKRRRW